MANKSWAVVFILFLIGMCHADNLTLVVTVQECIVDDDCTTPPMEYFCTRDNLTCVYAPYGVCTIGNCTYSFSCMFVNGSCGHSVGYPTYSPPTLYLGENWLLLFLSGVMMIGLAGKRMMA